MAGASSRAERQSEKADGSAPPPSMSLLEQKSGEGGGCTPSCTGAPPGEGVSAVGVTRRLALEPPARGGGAALGAGRSSAGKSARPVGAAGAHGGSGSLVAGSGTKLAAGGSAAAAAARLLPWR